MIKLNSSQEKELFVAIDTFRSRALSYHDGEMGGRAKEAYDYYYGNLPAPITQGSSRYVDRTVWETVNGVLQDTLNVFTSSDDAVKFAPESLQDGPFAAQATSYVNRVLLRDNDGYRVLHDTFKESFLTRAGWNKIYWENKIEEIEEQFVNVTMEELEVLQIDPEILVTHVEESEGGKTYSGELTRYCDRSGVRIEFVPFEHALIDPTATCIEDASYCAVRVRKTVEELIDMGFDPEVIQRGKVLGGGDGASSLDYLAISRQNNLNPEANDYGRDMVPVTEEDLAERVWLYENYIKTSLLTRHKSKKNRKVQLLQVFTIGHSILEVNEVSEVPLEICTPLPIPASVFGESIFDITKDLQDLQTSLIRGHIDNVMNANFGRYTALKGQYDRRSLLDNRPGGVVEINALNAINLMPYHPLPQGSDVMIERVEQSKERRTGVTRLGMGLSPEVFKNDNAYATVNMMMSASQNRMRMIARNIAKGYMTNVMLRIYRLARENETRPITVEIQGQQLQVVPAMWPCRNEMVTSVAIGANENRERAQNLVNLLNLASQNPLVAGTTFSAKNANYTMQELVKAMGFNDVLNFVTPTSQIPPAQPSPAEQLEMAKVQAEVQDKQMSAQERQAKAQLEMAKLEVEKMRLQMEQQKQQLESQRLMMQMQFEQEKAADEMDTRQAESESRQDELADRMMLAQHDMQLKDREMAIKEKELDLKQQELQLKKQELILEASLEHAQGRGVGLGD